jgi:hypothetical protein
MGGHVVVPFQVVPVGRVAIRRQAPEDRLQIPPHVRIGVLGDHQGATGVLHEHMAQPDGDAGARTTSATRAVMSSVCFDHAS